MNLRNNHDTIKINRKLVYTKYKMIENCTFDKNEINAFYRDPFKFEMETDQSVKVKKKGKKKGKKGKKNKENDEIKETEDGFDYDGYFDAQFGSHGLPKNYEWKLKCPVLALKLKKKGEHKYYCNVCKKNVYIVENEQEMNERVSKGQCIQYTMSGKPSRIKDQRDHPYPTPRSVKRGKVKRRY